MKQIIVTIAPDGSTKVAVSGMVGKSCKDATKAIEAALGQTTKDETQPEFYAHDTQPANNQAGR